MLQDNKSYLISTLQLEGIDIEYSDKASEKTQEECRPGAPFIVFRVDPSIDLNFINDQPHTGKSNVKVRFLIRANRHSPCFYQQVSILHKLFSRPFQNNMSHS